MDSGGRLLAVIAVVLAIVIASCSALQLSETAQESVVVSAGSGSDFGMVTVGSTPSPVKIITVAPASGNQSDVVTSITANCNDFAVMVGSGALPATVSQTCGSGSGTDGSGTDAFDGNGTCDSMSFMFPVTFTPTGTGGFEQCTIHIIVSGTDNPITVQGTGVVSSYLIDATPSPDPIGQIKVNTTSPASTITVTNIGSMDLMISSVNLANLTQAGVFTLMAGGSGSVGAHTLPFQTKETYQVTCKPPSTMTYTATLTIVSNATNSPNDVVTITCDGTTSDLTISPKDFGQMRVGDPTKQLMLKLVNNGTADSNVTGYTLANNTSDLTVDNASDTGPIPAFGGTLTVVLDYTPTTTHAAGEVGELDIAYDSTQYAAIITGEVVTTSMAVSLSQVDFGPMCVGQTSTQHVTAYANNAGSFTVSGVTAPSSPFTLSSLTFPFVVDGDHTNELAFDVTAAPTVTMASASQTTIQTDIPGSADLEIALTVLGLPDGIQATPSKIDFGLNHVMELSSGMEAVFTNCSAGSVNVTDATITGVNASEFKIFTPDENAIPQLLAPRQSEVFTLVMTPFTNGQKVANLQISYDPDMTATVELDGQVDQGSGDSTKDRETYYACSTGRPAAVWPIGLALLALRRRRR